MDAQRAEHVCSIDGPSEVAGTYSVQCTCGWRVRTLDSRKFAERLGTEHYDQHKRRGD